MSPGRASSATSGGEIGGIGERARIAMPVLDQPGDDRVARHALDRRLAGGVDIGDEDDVGIVEAGAEAVEQMRHAGVAVRLHDGDDLAGNDRARRLQHRRDLDRMVAVIVDHGHAVPLAGLGEAALDPLEIAQRRAQRVVAEPERLGDRRRGQRILHVVLAEHRQKQVGDRAPALRQSASEMTMS